MKNLSRVTLLFGGLTLASLFPLAGHSTGGAGDFFREAWDVENDPLLLGPVYERKFDELPSSQQVKKLPWGDTYWPSYKGGIAYRWARSNYSEKERLPFRYQSPAPHKVRQMSQWEVGSLSPAEKYDLLMGRYDYPTVAHERGRTHAEDPEWFGLCHGWAAASINFPKEPKPVVMESRDGIKIPFGASDIKALLAFYQGQLTDARTLFLGSRCEVDFNEHPAGSGVRECLDTNAGSFHVILTNLVGIQRVPFIADTSRDAEVWNFPVVSYSSKILQQKVGASPGAAPGTVAEIELKTQVEYAVAVEANWELTGTAKERKDYHYRLELNNQGEIIGGEWLGFERPDFLWVQDRPQFSGYYAGIQKIYNKSTHWFPFRDLWD